MKLKKIIIFYPSFERGGVEIVLINLIKYILKKKIIIDLVTSGSKKKFPKNKNFNHIQIKNTKFNLLPSRVSRALHASKSLSGCLKNSNPNSTIVFSLQSSSLAIIVSKLYKFKIVVRNAEDPIYSTIFADERILSTISFISKIFTYNFANKIITNSKGSKKSIDKLIINKKKSISIYNPYLKKIYKKNTSINNNYILSVGRLTKQKDLETLIYAMKIVVKKINTKLLIIGDGYEKNHLKKLILNLNLSKNVKILGWKNNIFKYYKKAKLFVLSSLYEGLGNVVIDAVNHEIPCIVTECKSGPKEIINYGKGGFIVPIANSQRLSEKIIYCFKNYKDAKKKILYSKKKIKRFSIELNSKKYFNILQNVVNG